MKEKGEDAEGYSKKTKISINEKRREISDCWPSPWSFAFLFLYFIFFFTHLIFFFHFCFIYLFPPFQLYRTDRAGDGVMICKVAVHSLALGTALHNSAVSISFQLFFFFFFFLHFIHFSSRPLAHDEKCCWRAGTCSYNNHDKLFIIIIISLVSTSFQHYRFSRAESIYFNSSTCYVFLLLLFFFRLREGGCYFPCLWRGLLVLGLGEQCPHIIRLDCSSLFSSFLFLFFSFPLVKKNTDCSLFKRPARFLVLFSLITKHARNTCPAQSQLGPQ